MKKIQLVQTSLLAIISLCAIGIVAQNQIIIHKLSQDKVETPLVRQASFKSGQNLIAIPLNADGSIDVNVRSVSETVDVNIEEVGGYNTYGKVPVRIKE